MYNRVFLTDCIIIVTVFNAYECFSKCLYSLLMYTPPCVNIIIINDGSTDERIGFFLSKLDSINNIFIVNNYFNIGYTKSINKALNYVSDKHVIVLNSDSYVTPRWLEGLVRAANSDEYIGTVTPLSNNAGVFSAPNYNEINLIPNDISEADFSVCFRRFSSSIYPKVPTGNGFCMFIRHQCLKDVGYFDDQSFPYGYGEENDFCIRATYNGWKHVIDDCTYIFHDRSQSFGDKRNNLVDRAKSILDEKYPEYSLKIQVFINDDDIIQARRNAEFCLNYMVSGNSLLPRILYVISNCTGGTYHTNKDLMRGVSGKYEAWLLHSDREVMTLYKYSDKDNIDEVVLRHKLELKISPHKHDSIEYEQVVSDWLHKFDFEIVHIRHIGWHSLKLPELAKNAGASVFYSFHDYYSICPSLKLIDNSGVFCNGICSSSLGNCKSELWPEVDFIGIKNDWVFKWRRMMSDMFQHCDYFITTHKSVKDLILSFFDIPVDKVAIIPHGRNFVSMYNYSEVLKFGQPLKIVVLGTITESKGLDVIKNLIKLDVDNNIHFYFIGNDKSNDLSLDAEKASFFGSYSRDDFPNLIKKIRPHLGVVFSVWNETWSHTLTELWSVGLPVIVFDYPTLADRVCSNKSGWVFSDKDINELYFKLTSITKNDLLNKVARTLIFQKKLACESTFVMSERYIDLYQKMSLGSPKCPNCKPRLIERLIED
jgi:GT2 family glycosyltransferase/glycosyltransferase involved in cell wall biosynthesis